MNKEMDQHVRSLKNGDNDAFDYLYYQTKNSVFLVILSILKDYSLTEDIMQDTYMNMIRVLDKYQEGTNFKNWIVTMARNLAINEYNRRRKETLVDITEENNLFGGIEDTNKYDGWLINDLIEHLDEQERQVFLLRIVEGMLHKEISQVLDMPLGTVLWIYQKAIRKLKKFIKQGGGEQ